MVANLLPPLPVPEFRFDDELLSKPLDECLKSSTFVMCFESLESELTREPIFNDVSKALELPFESYLAFSNNPQVFDGMLSKQFRKQTLKTFNCVYTCLKGIGSASKMLKDIEKREKVILEEIAKKRNLCKCAVELRFQIKDANGLYDDTLYIVPIPRKKCVCDGSSLDIRSSSMQSATTQASNNDIEAHVDVSLYYHGGDQSARRKERIELFVKLAKRNGIKLNDLSRLNLDDLRSELTKLRAVFVIFERSTISQSTVNADEEVAEPARIDCCAKCIEFYTLLNMDYLNRDDENIKCFLFTMEDFATTFFQRGVSLFQYAWLLRPNSELNGNGINSAKKYKIPLQIPIADDQHDINNNNDENEHANNEMAKSINAHLECFFNVFYSTLNNEVMSKLKQTPSPPSSYAYGPCRRLDI